MAKSFRIFLAEDDTSIQAITKVALERIGKHRVQLASDGQELVEALKNCAELPDVILIDVMMPRMNGFDACKAIKADPRFKDIPIIFLTARAQAHEIQNGMNLGSDAYILKPFDPMTLHLRIEEIVFMKYGAKAGAPNGACDAA